MTAAKNILRELTTKTRAGWEANGYEDGVAGRDDRVPEGRMSVRDTYMVGWRDGNQARAIQEAANDE